MKDVLQKHNMQGTIDGDIVQLSSSGKPVKFTTDVEEMFKDLSQVNPKAVIEIVPQGVTRKFILSKDGWFYLQDNGKLKPIKKKTVAVMIYKLTKGVAKE